MTGFSTPPQWADALLRLLLEPGARDSVSGDLLEQYRDSVRPHRGRWRADAWYVMQVAGFLWRSVWVWVVLRAAAVIGRDTLDWWLSPTNDFYARATVTTTIGVAVFTCAGLSAAWRSRSIRAGVLAGAATGLIGAVIINVVSLAQLAVRHDPHTMRMIESSGGLDEVFLLPFIVIVPGTICATAGALVGRSLAWFRRSEVAQ